MHAIKRAPRGTDEIDDAYDGEDNRKHQRAGDDAVSHDGAA